MKSKGKIPKFPFFFYGILTKKDERETLYVMATELCQHNMLCFAIDFRLSQCYNTTNVGFT